MGGTGAGSRLGDRKGGPCDGRGHSVCGNVRLRAADAATCGAGYPVIVSIKCAQYCQISDVFTGICPQGREYAFAGSVAGSLCQLVCVWRPSTGIGPPNTVA